MQITLADLQDARRHITAAEAQACLGIPASTIRAWAHRYQLHPVRIEDGSTHARGYPLVRVLELAATRRPRVAH